MAICMRIARLAVVQLMHFVSELHLVLLLFCKFGQCHGHAPNVQQLQLWCHQSMFAGSCSLARFCQAHDLCFDEIHPLLGLKHICSWGEQSKTNQFAGLLWIDEKPNALWSSPGWISAPSFNDCSLSISMTTIMHPQWHWFTLCESNMDRSYSSWIIVWPSVPPARTIVK